MLRFGAPVDSAVSLNLVRCSIDFPGWAVIEQAIDFLIEYKLTDQPSAIRCGPRQVRVLTRK